MIQDFIPFQWRYALLRIPAQTDWGAIFAMSTPSLLPVFLIFTLFQKYIVEGIQHVRVERLTVKSNQTEKPGFFKKPGFLHVPANNLVRRGFDEQGCSSVQLFSQEKLRKCPSTTVYPLPLSPISPIMACFGSAW